MSDEYPSGGGGGGWSHNWYPSSATPSSASPDTQFSSPPPTQSSGIPSGVYRPYPADMQNVAEGQYGWSSDHGSTQPLSQLPHGHNAGGGGGGRGDGGRGFGGDPHVRTPYTPREVDQLFVAYVAVSEDASVGTNQTGETFWIRIRDIYNANRPAGTVERNESMLRNAFKRADAEIKRFQGLYLEEQRSAGSGSNDADVIAAALTAYSTIMLKPFKHISTWKKVHMLPRWVNGTESSSSGSTKRSRGPDVGEDEVASQLAGAHLTSTDSDAGPSRGRRRPTGQKKTRTNRRAAAEQPPFVPPPPPAAIPPNPNTLYPVLQVAINTDTSRMAPEQREAHFRMIYSLQVQLGIIDPSRVPPPN